MGNIIELKLSAKELKVLNEIIKNEMVTFDTPSVTKSKKNQELKNYLSVLKGMTKQVEQQLNYAGSV